MGLLGETVAAWNEVTPSGEIDGTLLDAMPAEWAAPLRPTVAPPSNADITRQTFDSLARVVSPRVSLDGCRFMLDDRVLQHCVFRLLWC